MFKEVDGHILWGDTAYIIPEELKEKKILKIYGTATSGLRRRPAIFLRVRSGESVEVAIEKGNISGRLIGDVPVRGEIVHIREQLEPVSGKIFWLVSKEEIRNDINWINVQFDDYSTLVICPFTRDYGIR